MEFITITHPSKGTSAKLKRQAYAHAARVTHARARKRQVANYLRQNGVMGEEIPEGDASDYTLQYRTQVAMHRQQHSQALVHQGAQMAVPPVLSGAFEHEPFVGFLRSLTAREHFMFNHYVQVVFPHLAKHCPLIQNPNRTQLHMRNNWFTFSSNDVDFLRGFLLAACRHLSMVCLEDEYAQLAIQYKLRNIQVLRETISTDDPALARIAVTRALVLALDEIMLGDFPMAGKHVSGAFHVVQRAGGPQALGLTTFITYVLDSCIRGKRLMDWDSALRCGDEFMKPESACIDSGSAWLIEPPATRHSLSIDTL